MPKIVVTDEDIHFGERNSTGSCPVARAIKRTLNTIDVYVDEDYITHGTTNFQTTLEVKYFIEQFDRGEFVEPFEFDLE